MKHVHLIQFGVGNVGTTLIRQIMEQQASLARIGIGAIRYIGLFDMNTCLYSESCIQNETLKTIITREVPFDKLPFLQERPDDVLPLMKQMHGYLLENTIVVDVTTAGTMGPVLVNATELGCPIVLANKKPLSDNHALFNYLRTGRIRHETTVGAGLPVVRTLDDLLATGDEIITIQGCFSGTLGFLCSELEKGRLFSEIVIEAKSRGYTERDPREDLSGRDVARKALILARMTGAQLEMSDVEVESLYPDAMAQNSIDGFMQRLPELDTQYKERFAEAEKQHATLRYVATVKGKHCSVRLEQVPKASDIGALNGPENIVVFQTKRYDDNPLSIKGPGAGLEVTAAGLFADILSLV
jgi:homoserine dehydrogenase